MEGVKFRNSAGHGAVMGVSMIETAFEGTGCLLSLETRFAFLLLIGSGLMIRSLVRLQQEDHGFRPDHVLTLRVPVGPTGKYDTRPRQMAYYLNSA